MRDLIEELRDLQEATVGHDLDKVYAAFLSITSAKRMNSTKTHLEKLLKGYEAGEIYNVDYKDAKDFLGRTVDETWKERTDHFWVGRGGNNPESAFLDYLGFFSSLNDILSKRKRLDNLKPTTKLTKWNDFKGKDVNPDFIKVAHEVVDAAYPVALIVKELKTKVVKGRKPNPEAIAKREAQLAKKDMKTCACCFRSIARLKNGLIADHGYTLPRQWMKTASCPGRDFRPLEVSDDGLKFMIKTLEKHVSMLTTRIAGSRKLKTLNVKKGWGKDTETITPEHPKWDYHLKVLQTNLEQELKRAQADLKTFETKLAHWEPVPGA